MENIFENAYLGKPYKTRGGDKVVYLRTFICDGYYHMVSNGILEYAVRDNGEIDSHLYKLADDIVAEWQEPIHSVS